MTYDPVELASRLIAVPSITPARGEVFDVLEAALRPLGFEIHRFVLGETTAVRYVQPFAERPGLIPLYRASDDETRC